jgi:NAD(P)-dependent dehydrogenase (short-subunit alcohol dehydrogenase family)
VSALAELGAQVAFSYLSSASRAQTIVEKFDRANRSVNADQADPATHELLDDPERDGTAMQRQVIVNCTSILAIIRAVIPLLPQRGRIINVGSRIATRAGAQGVADPRRHKAALGGFTRGAARDLAPRAITVNLVQTGLIATDLSNASRRWDRRGRTPSTSR